MELRRAADGLIHKPPRPDSPTITVMFGGEDDSGDVGLLKVRIPAGSVGLTEHQHNGSDVILTPISGHVRITKGDQTIEVHAGDSALVYKDEAVALSNPGTEEAEVLVSAGPANFVAAIRGRIGSNPQPAER